ncbi:MAG: hypothetical protein LBF33_00980 [Oscillospiraceae bacterium]|jgi:hypothetical protein|nr:hypothetical protein [Oscillospiraceae bacterium]
MDKYKIDYRSKNKQEKRHQEKENKPKPSFLKTLTFGDEKEYDCICDKTEENYSKKAVFFSSLFFLSFALITLVFLCFTFDSSQINELISKMY